MMLSIFTGSAVEKYSINCLRYTWHVKVWSAHKACRHYYTVIDMHSSRYGLSGGDKDGSMYNDKNHQITHNSSQLYTGARAVSQVMISNQFINQN